MVPTTFNWIWGWASWQRAWQDYRFDISEAWTSPDAHENIRNYLANELNFYGHRRNFDELVKSRVDTWDFQWSFALLAQRRVTLVSAVNLIENLGFDAEATHTVNEVPYLRGLRVHPTVPTGLRRDTGQPDRIHDKLFGEVIHGSSASRIALLRLLARFPAVARLLLKT